jgi:hypothetical protein
MRSEPANASAGMGRENLRHRPHFFLYNYKLAVLVYGGRQRQPQTLAKYDSVLDQLASMWREHGKQAGGTFYEQYYLPMAQNTTELTIGRSPMPIATVVSDAADGSSTKVELTVFGTDIDIRYTVDISTPSPSSPLYTKQVQVPTGSQLRAVSDASGLDLSRELLVVAQ